MSIYFIDYLVKIVYTEKICTITTTKPILSTVLQLWRYEYRFIYCHAYKFIPVNIFPFPLTVNTVNTWQYTLLSGWQDFMLTRIHSWDKYRSHPSNDVFHAWTHQSAVKTWLTNVKWIPLIFVYKIRILICNMRWITLKD